MNLFNSKNEKPNKAFDMVQEVQNNNEEYKFEIISGENRFETKILTYCNFLINNRDLIKESIINSKNDVYKEILDFVSFNDIILNTHCFKFVLEFADAYNYITTIFPIRSRQRVCVTKNEDIKSTKVDFFITCPKDSLFVKEDTISFDFYSVPNKINTALELMDSDISLELKQYIDNDTFEKDAMYVEISRIICKEDDTDINEKHITLRNCTISNIDDTYDCIWLNAIHNEIFKTCKNIFISLLHNVEEYLIGEYKNNE